MSVLAQPGDCSERKLAEFAALVRQGFPAARDLERRISEARWLGFHRPSRGRLLGCAALKAPDLERRREVFEQAGAGPGARLFQLDLGWVFVDPGHRRRGVARDLCERLVERAATEHLFSTTRTGNVGMQRILRELGFERVGRPYPRGAEELVLFLRSAQP